MNLFINAVSNKGIIILFDNKRQILDKQNIEVLLNESSNLLENIDSFMDKNNIVYNNIENIIVVNGPGSFTGLRTIALIVNTINYIIKKSITTINFFELFNNYPIIKSSSRRDIFIKENKNKEIKILSNDEALKLIKENNIKDVYGDLSNNFFENINLNSDIDYEKIIKNISFDNKKIIKPLYIKKPNIS